MTVSVSIKVDMAKAKRFMTNVQKKQIPFATAQAITSTLHVARKDEVKQLRRDIDRPNPWTLRAFRVDGAKKTTLTGRLYILPDQIKYLKYQIYGGVRLPKGSALALKPAKPMTGDVRLDKYGNISRTQQARAQLARGAFSGTVSGVPGIWMPPKMTKTGKRRKGSRMKLLLAYERQAVYRPRFRFFERGQRSITTNWPREFNKAFKRAIRSAR